MGIMRKRGKRLGVGDWNDDKGIGYVGFQSLSKPMRESVNNVSIPTAARKSQQLVPRGVPNPRSAMKNFSYKNSIVHTTNTTTPTPLEQQDNALLNCRGVASPPAGGHKIYHENDGRNLIKIFQHSNCVDGQQSNPTDAFHQEYNNKSVPGTDEQSSSIVKGRKGHTMGSMGDYWSEFKRQHAPTTTSHLKPVALCQLQDTTNAPAIINTTSSDNKHSLSGSILVSDNNRSREDGKFVVGGERVLKQDNNNSDEARSHSTVASAQSSKYSKLLMKKNNQIDNQVRDGLCDSGDHTNQEPCVTRQQPIHDESIEVCGDDSLLKGKKTMSQQHVYGKWSSNMWESLCSRRALEASSENEIAARSVCNTVDDKNVKERKGLSSPPPNPGKCSKRAKSKRGGIFFSTRLRRSRRHGISTMKESYLSPRQGDSACQPVDLADSSDESVPLVRKQGHHRDEEGEEERTITDNVIPCSSLNPLPGNGLEILVLAVSLNHHVFCKDMRLILKPWERTVILTDRERQSSAFCTYSEDTGMESEDHHKNPLNPKIGFVRLLMEELTSFRYGYVPGDYGFILLEAKDCSESLSTLLNFVRSLAEDQLASLSGNDSIGNDYTIASQILDEEERALLEEEEGIHNHKSDGNDDSGGKTRHRFWLCLTSAKSFDGKTIPSCSLGRVSSYGAALEKNSEGATAETEMMISVREKAEKYIQTSSPMVDISPVSTKVTSVRLDLIVERYVQVNLCKGERDRLKVATPSRTHLAGRQMPAERTSDNGNTNNDDELVLAYPMDAGASGIIQILRSDYLRLREGEFLNDSVIDFYLKFMLREDPVIRKKVMYGGQSSVVHVFTSHFFSKLSEVPLRAGSWEAIHSPVSRWSKSFNIWKTRFLFIPVVEHLHWSLAVVCNLNAVVEERHRKIESPPSNNTVATTEQVLEPSTLDRPQPCIIFMDSLRLHKPRRIAGYLRAYLTQELRSSDPNTLPFTDANLPCIAPCVPSQSNGCDCGIFVIKYVDHILRTWPAITCQDIDTKLKNIINPHSFDCFNAVSMRKQMKTELETLAMKYKEMQKKRKISNGSKAMKCKKR